MKKLKYYYNGVRILQTQPVKKDPDGKPYIASFKCGKPSYSK